MIIKVVRDRGVKKDGAVTGRVFVDNVFFGYSLENDDYKIPLGNYDIMLKNSPTFKKNKVYISVPNRTNILFHGGNTVNDTKGCIIVAAERDGNNVKGDQSDFLFDVVDGAVRNGEAVGVYVRNNNDLIYAAICFLGLMIFNLTKSR